MNRKERLERIIEYFQQAMPMAETELTYQSPYELLVAVILSAQCTDKRVNQITPSLIRRFPSPIELSEASPDEVFQYIKSCSYPNSKTRHLIGMAQKLVKEYKGIVPSKVEDLMKLPGVGRKTANVIASVVFNKPVMPVDTHVFRVTSRLGLIKNVKTPLAAEKQLVQLIPENLITISHHWFILHGRYVCTSRKPKCSICGLVNVCPYKNKNLME
jgi:endonuclease-3